MNTKRFIFLCCTWLVCAGMCAQTYSDEISPQTEEPESIRQNDQSAEFVDFETMPEFPGGQQRLLAYLSENVRYPRVAKENKIQGRVVCSFIVEKNGKINDVQVVRSGGDPSLDKEAVRVIKSMPRWKPGTQEGKPVRVRFNIPINFQL